MARSRKGREPEEEGRDRWLITYSDLITLLMIFFVIMYAMSQVSQAKFYALEQSLAQALHQSRNFATEGVGTTSIIEAANPTDKGKKLNPGSSSQQTQEDKTFDSLYQEISQYIKQHNLQANVSLQNETRGIQITFKDVVLFDTGQATIKPQARQILDGLAPFIKTVNNPVVVEGYTDNQPISTPQFPSNWELSAARAINVVRFYQSVGIDPARLSGVGYGEYHPLVPNTTPANRQKNRRVNIVIVRNPATSTGSSTTVNSTSVNSNGTSIAGMNITVPTPPTNATITGNGPG